MAHWMLSSIVLCVFTIALVNATNSCKAFPGDVDWPDDAAWDRLNKTVGGALIKTVPPAAVCHSSWPEYNATKCIEVFNHWSDFDDAVADPAYILYPYYQGYTCVPTTNSSTPCTIGGLPLYSINVSHPNQISAGIQFARNKNIRLVIKNTGHDISGKSTGAGSLSIWTHNLKNISFNSNYSSSYYTGPVMKVGAGVELEEYYKAAQNYGVTAVGGECSSVGVAGGYMAGGGHSPSGGLFGMGADQVVSLEAVLPDGRHVTIDNFTNPDLFWAFRGGGGSTFGVVTSMTVKSHPKIPVTVGYFNFNTTNISNDTFWEGVRTYFDFMPTIADSGSQSFITFGQAGTGSGLSLSTNSFFAANMSIAGYDSLMLPWFEKLHALGISFESSRLFFDNYYDGWKQAFPVITGPFTGFSYSTASRLIPRSNWDSPTTLDETFQTFKNIVNDGYALYQYTQNNKAKPGIDNAINPAYRTSLAFTFAGSVYSENTSPIEINALRKDVVKVIDEMKSISPGGGTYLNEAYSLEPDFQQSFWGSHYDRLLAIKQKVDPDGIFYAPLAVGSEFWYLEGGESLLPDVQTGRLCRKHMN